jgi:hypothetical protein
VVASGVVSAGGDGDDSGGGVVGASATGICSFSSGVAAAPMPMPMNRDTTMPRIHGHRLGVGGVGGGDAEGGPGSWSLTHPPLGGSGHMMPDPQPSVYCLYGVRFTRTLPRPERAFRGPP